MKIYVKKPFDFAHRGYDIKRIEKGEQDVSKRCAEVALEEGWATKKATMPENKAVEPPKNKEYPKHTGGGWYELSDNEKVRGEEKAIKAQKELK